MLLICSCILLNEADAGAPERAAARVAAENRNRVEDIEPAIIESTVTYSDDGTDQNSIDQGLNYDGDPIRNDNPNSG